MSLSLIIIVLGTLSGAAAAAPANAPEERRPNLPVSIANVAPAGSERNGPLFRQIDRLSVSKSEDKLISSLSDDVKIVLYSKINNFTNSEETRQFFHALLKDCQGPYSIDEAITWVQTSWVCHVGEDRLIHRYFLFKESPEISIEFTFANDRIRKIFAAEILPLPMPGKSKYLPKNAAETIPDKR